jgi:N5-(carboxyethyl)ornithine synthase
MKTIGFIISKKENEKRRAIVPNDLKHIQNRGYLYFEKGYGLSLGYSDDEYSKLGCNIADRDIVLKQDIICDPKIGDAEYINLLKEQTIFGWLHAVQNKSLTEKLISREITAYAWEEMYEDNRHVFWRNNEIAGEAAIMHAFQCYGVMPYNTKVAILGKGNTARGALKILTMLGADVVVYDRRTEKLFQQELGLFDVIVNAILWDIKRKDHIIYKEDLKRLKKNSMIIDISCDRCGAVETSVPTTIVEPIYIVDDIIHYAVDHTPSMFHITTSMGISEQISKYIDIMIEEKENSILSEAKIIEKGKIIDNKINIFQNRK